jgi:D-ribose pyranose/furanose isomerase RbsD
MKVFICWSEDRSKVVAETLRDWLKKVIQQLEPFLSTQDIRTGKRWSLEIASQLGETKFGILCLTRENLDSPWLNFEAGALSKTIDNRTFVCPYLIGGLQPAEVPDPLGQFQSNLADREGTLKLIKTINSALTEKKLEEVVLNETFEKFWPDLEKALRTLPPVKGEEIPKRKVEDMVEEILNTVRGLTFRMQNLEENFGYYPKSLSFAQLLQSMPRPRTLQEFAFAKYLDEIKTDDRETLAGVLEGVLKAEKEREAREAKKEELKKKEEKP